MYILWKKHIKFWWNEILNATDFIHIPITIHFISHQSMCIMYTYAYAYVVHIMLWRTFTIFGNVY